jgi:hypothetical protein
MRFLIMIMIGIGCVFGGNLPNGYNTYKDVLYQEIDTIFPEFFVPPYFGGLIEHESCISLTHSKCWNPKSQLKTKREEGGGLPQLTRAYNNDGSIRFDTLSNLVKSYPKELKGLSWNTVYDRPDLQIRAMLLLWKSNYRLFNNKGIDYWDVIAMSDASYNAGYGNVYKDMQICKMKTNCNPKVWFGNVNTTCTRNRIIYGDRSACDIMNHHVDDVLNNKLEKYLDAWTEDDYIHKYKIKTE